LLRDLTGHSPCRSPAPSGRWEPELPSSGGPPLPPMSAQGADIGPTVPSSYKVEVAVRTPRAMIPDRCALSKRHPFQTPQGNDPAVLGLEVVLVGAELVGVGVDPGMFDVGDAVEGHDGDLAVAGLGDGVLELLEDAVGLAVEGLRKAEVIVDFGVESLAVPSAGVAVATLAEDFLGLVAGLRAGVAEGDGPGDAVASLWLAI